jgi:hypothetical protein
MVTAMSQLPVDSSRTSAPGKRSTFPLHLWIGRAPYPPCGALSGAISGHKPQDWDLMPSCAWSRFLVRRPLAFGSTPWFGGALKRLCPSSFFSQGLWTLCERPGRHLSSPCPVVAGACRPHHPRARSHHLPTDDRDRTRQTCLVRGTARRDRRARGAHSKTERNAPVSGFAQGCCKEVGRIVTKSAWVAHWNQPNRTVRSFDIEPPQAICNLHHTSVHFRSTTQSP